jgi:hypothetical protein
LNLASGKPLALVQELPCLDNLIKLDPLLASTLDPCVHYLISGCLFHAVRVELCWGYWWPPTYSNWLLLTVFSSTCFSVMMTFLCNCGFFTSGAILKPYTTSRWILVAAHLFQLAYFGSFHVNTSFCTSRAVLGP